MKNESWSRAGVIQQLREKIWRHLTQAARSEGELTLAASRLLQMRTSEVRTLAALYFVLSDEVGDLLDEMPSLIRRLSTSSDQEVETSAERVRGAIRWADTFASRTATGLPHLFVTAPSRRVYDTPENRLLRFALDSVSEFGRLTGWAESSSEEVGETVRDRVTTAVRWSRARALTEVRAPYPPAPRDIARVRSGRRQRTYAQTLAVVEKFDAFITKTDREALRRAIEDQALVTRDDPTLLELLCAFNVIDALKAQHWKGTDIGLIGGGCIFTARRGDDTLRLYFQRSPSDLSTESIYHAIQEEHEFAGVGGLTPDLVVSVDTAGGARRWILIEVKGVERPVADSARRASLDLLGYRRAYEVVLGAQPGPYGIGIAWGAGVQPALSSDEIVLCSPDTVQQAIDAVGL